MAYFKLAPVTGITNYPVDYHSHFTGVLPVRGKDERQPSLAKLLADAHFRNDPHKRDKAELQLFDYALQFMMDERTNPLARLVGSASRAEYERAECAAENIYVAAVLVGHIHYLDMDLLAEAAYRPDLYGAVRARIVKKALDSPGKPDEPLMKLVRYFNGKIYSSNKYTPFDDCYKMRGAFVKFFCDGDPAAFEDWADWQQERYRAWIRATFDYLREEGITHTQTAATQDEMKELAIQAAQYNAENDTSYKLLVHTPSQYLPDGKLQAYLEGAILPLLRDDKRDLVGIDLLGAENKVGNYRELFEFLRAQEAGLQANFGPAKPRALKLIVHIHCGEGSGFGSGNRSMIGYYLYEAGFPEESFFADLSGYIIRCYKAAEAKQLVTPRGTRGTATPFGLFDELFHDNSLTYRGRLLRRFAISSERSRELAAYNAKRNVMALSETFDSTPQGADRTWYQLLAEDSALFAFRLGHDYYYRNFMGAKYSQIAFDTNLGSNAITGASGLFNSIESYRINRGFRHLDGYIDTNVLHAAGDAVAYMASEALTQEQIAKFTDMSTQSGELGEILKDDKDNKAWIVQQLQSALGPIYPQIVTENYFYNTYCSLVLATAGGVDTPASRYQAMARVLALFRNWRSYLLGADGQGAEHSDIQHEFLRMLILLVYGLLPTGETRIDAKMLIDLQYLLRSIAESYWRATVGPAEFKLLQDKVKLELLEGFKAPDSVVTVRRSAV
ncbi:hypothetical protein [Luteimonas suaedae]|uniref:hypothetical protein n=1 Tax=Luteimonas suaedae TaxID=2605430 RepID=UPI0011F06173|nr:hypothetical protein [Luteimonas suaedae]